MQATEEWYHFNEKDVWTFFHSHAFDFSVWELWGGLLYGGRVVMVPYLTSRSPEDFYELLVKEGVTVLNQTPSAFKQLMQAEEKLGVSRELRLRYVIFGGEALEMHSLKPWFERHGDRKPLLVNMYGITETTVHVTYRPLSASDLESGSVIGVPIPDLQIYVLDRAAAAGADRGSGRDLRRRSGSGAWIPGARRADAPEVRAGHGNEQDRGRFISDGRSGAILAEPGYRILRTHRSTGEDPRLPD